MPWIDAAKGISIFLVVMVHGVHWLGSAGMDARTSFQELMGPLGHVRMPLFFFASGLFAAKWVRAPWPTLLQAKIALLAWTFLIWQVSVFAYKVLGGTVLPDEDGGVFGHVIRVLVSPARPNGELWFLWALALFIVLGRATVKWKPVVTIASAAVVSVSWSGVAQPLLGAELMRLLGPGLSKFPMYFVFFVVAALFSTQIRGLVAKIPLWLAGLVAVTWIAGFWWLDVLSLLPSLPVTAFIGQIVGIFGGVALAVLLSWFRPLTYLGERTLEVYLSHTGFIVALSCALYLGGVPISAWMVWVVVILAIIAGLALGRIARDTWLFQSPRWFAKLIAGDFRTQSVRVP